MLSVCTVRFLQRAREAIVGEVMASPSNRRYRETPRLLDEPYACCMRYKCGNGCAWRWREQRSFASLSCANRYKPHPLAAPASRRPSLSNRLFGAQPYFAQVARSMSIITYVYRHHWDAINASLLRHSRRALRIWLSYRKSSIISSWSLDPCGPRSWIRLWDRRELQLGARCWVSWPYRLVCLVPIEHADLQWGITRHPRPYY